MKKLLPIFIFISSFTFGQFTISESSDDWKLLGKKQSDISIYINGNKAKITTIDFRNKTIGFDPLSTFKTRGQQNADNLRGEIRKGNEGVKSGNYEFTFNIEPDTLDKLYEVIKSHFDTKTKEMITLTFPEGNLYLDFNSRTAFYAVSIGMDYDGQKIFSAPILKSHVDKLFGKK